MKHSPRKICLLAAVASFLLCSSPATAADKLPQRKRDQFENHVRPILVKHCIKCHGHAKQEGKLRLTSIADLLKGGESGPAIVPGKPAESLLLEAVRYESLEMPPDGRLDAKIVGELAKWIEDGAPWPADVVLKPGLKISEQDRGWWAYQPVSDPPLPAVKNLDWCRNEIDRFVLAKLEANSITPALQATPGRLIRRLNFALTGLPPSAKDVSSTGEQRLPDAQYAKLIETLLDSPAYGENQARFWLDLVRYAETDGYRADHPRPEAKRYRDYVIRSFNADKPYDRFVMEQLAGDEIAPGNRDAHIATMFLRHWIYEHNQRDVEGQWDEILNDITETAADVFLAQGVKCARCHDHKFDPILQKDYFRMKAFFAAFQPRENMPVGDVPTREAYLAKLQEWESATQKIRTRLHEIENPVLLKNASREGFTKFVPEIRSMIEKQQTKREPYEQQIASLASRQFDVHPEKLPEWLDKDLEAERQQLRKQLAQFDSMKPKPLPTMTFVSSDVGPVAPVTFIPDDPDKTPIAPGFLTVLDERPAKIDQPPAALQSTGRRTAFAKWLTDPANPLTARVIVNRVWQQHFGRGLVATSSDFGQLGTPPSHPQLLDWLTRRFVEDGWSLKALHRRIVSSATYRQSALRPADEHLRRLDPGNVLLWRMNPRRLSGEEIRDVMLTASGELSSQKRSVYVPVKRNQPDPLLSLFDSPDRIRSTGRRHTTTTAKQALLLTNGEWTNARATAMASRTIKLPDAEFVRTTYATLFGRMPDAEEQALAAQFLSSYSAEGPSQSATEPGLLTDMPRRSGKAVNIVASKPVDIRVTSTDQLPNGDFTVEAIILLRSLFADAKVRTIVSHWDSSTSHIGWSLGVTSTKSGYKPRNFILQFVGKKGDGVQTYEVVPSGLRPELNKPYYLAATVKLGDRSEKAVTFYMRDLSNSESQLESAQAPHMVLSNIRPTHALTVGSRFGASHNWDGLIDQVRLHNRVLTADELEFGKTADAAIDLRFDDGDQIGRDSSAHANHASIGEGSARSPKAPPGRIALVHALLNSNELIYVD